MSVLQKLRFSWHAQFKNKTFKTVIDAKHGYNGVLLRESDKHLTTLSLRLTGSDILEHLKALFHLVMVKIVVF